MPKSLYSPRNERSRADYISQREIFPGARNHKSRNDMIGNDPYPSPNVTFVLTGTAIAGGVLESEIVTGGETVIITLTGDTWVPTIGADNAITTALIAGITGDLEDAAGWNAEVAITHANVARTSDTVVTITLPAAGSYSITSGDETVTVDIPAVALTKNDKPATTKTFVITEGS